MRAVIQRVLKSSVTVDDEIQGETKQGLVVLLGIKNGDDESTASYLANKIVNLRIFEDEDGKFNLSALDVNAGILAISQFTLYGDCRKGRRPSFSEAAHPDISKPLYDKFVGYLRESGLHVGEGVFGAHMDVEIHNDGPVTIIIDSEDKTR
jgi:D-aminoacyl-tRNA deacylase